MKTANSIKLHPQHKVDIITNSSSELFIIKKEDGESDYEALVRTFDGDSVNAETALAFAISNNKLSWLADFVYNVDCYEYISKQERITYLTFEEALRIIDNAPSKKNWYYIWNHYDYTYGEDGSFLGLLTFEGEREQEEELAKRGREYCYAVTYVSILDDEDYDNGDLDLYEYDKEWYMACYNEVKGFFEKGNFFTIELPHLNECPLKWRLDRSKFYLREVL